MRDVVTFTFALGENWLRFTEVDFSQIITSNGSLSKPTYTLSDDGLLTMNF